MNKPQITTAGGVAGLVASIQNFASLFGDHTLAQIGEAVKAMAVSDVVVSLVGIIASIWAIYHNEDASQGAPPPGVESYAMKE